MLLFKKVLNFLLPFTKYSVEIVHVVLNFIFQYSVQQEMKDVIQESRAWEFLLCRNKSIQNSSSYVLKNSLVSED